MVYLVNNTFISMTEIKYPTEFSRAIVNIDVGSTFYYLDNITIVKIVRVVTLVGYDMFVSTVIIYYISSNIINVHKSVIFEYPLKLSYFYF